MQVFVGINKKIGMFQVIGVCKCISGNVIVIRCGSINGLVGYMFGFVESFVGNSDVGWGFWLLCVL